MVPCEEVKYLLGIRGGAPRARQNGEDVVPSGGVVVEESKDELEDWSERGPVLTDQARDAEVPAQTLEGQGNTGDASNPRE